MDAKSSGSDLSSMMRRTSRAEFNKESTGDLFRPEYGMESDQVKNEKLWKLMSRYTPISCATIQTSIVRHVEYTLAKNRFNFGNKHCYQAVSHSVRDRLIESFNDTQQYMHHVDAKRVYYMSLEFLLGRNLQNSLVNLALESNYKEALQDLGFNLETLYAEEQDPALGNGGLGRLAACFLDSLASLDYPAWGYGIRYNYGIFKQQIIQGYQVEVPDYWLSYGNPWEIQRLDVQYPVRFYGQVRKLTENGKERSVWEGGEIVLAEAYDSPLPGFNTFNSINLRLWKSVPTHEFDFSSFNHGDYFKAIEARQRAEYISSVLYPNDNTSAGKELRLKQQYFFVCATLQDAMRRFKKRRREWSELPNKMAIQLNDTHPALAIVEMLRILIDQEGLTRETAFELVYKIFAYTNHTVLPEALERWSVELLGNLLPRHLELIYLINYHWLEKIKKKFPGNVNKLKSLSIIEEGPIKFVRMANLCIVGSHTVNGVAAIHSQLLRTTLFKDFYELNPNKFQNKTNGVTPRRWVRCCNPGLANFYTKYLKSEEWLSDMTLIKGLIIELENPVFISEFQSIKQGNKKRLARWIRQECGVIVNEDSLFDVMVKRMHEYKRQLMNALYIAHRYLTIKDATPEERRNFVPRTIMIGGKAAPGYLSAKRIIKFISCLSDTINNDPDLSTLLKVVFLPNYNVSNAEVIIPAADLSQHISTAGTEASGTSCMKFCFNGGVIIGTLDGANVEIQEEVGKENIFIFGAKVEEVEAARQRMKTTSSDEYVGKELKRVFDSISNGTFGNREELVSMIDSIRHRNDFYLVCHDFYSYLDAQKQVDLTYQNPVAWYKKAICNSLLSSKFSSDRTIIEYANQIWGIQQIAVPKPSGSESDRSKIYS